MTPEIKRLYLQIQSSGGPSSYFPERHAESALRDASIIARFRELQREDLVRLLGKRDHDYRWNENDPREHEKFGPCAWGSIAQWRPTPFSKWIEADSCWGHVGYKDHLSPFENPYIIDHMSSCISHFNEYVLVCTPPCGAD